MTRLTTGLALAVSLLLLGCGGEDAPTPSPAVSDPSATVAKGGLLYDKYWKVSSAEEPTETHPLWEQRPDKESNQRTGADTWRCKECHGWDYKGVDGAYARGSHKTGFKGILQSQMSDAELMTSLADTHGYRAAGLNDVELQSLVKFVREGLTDSSKWIDESGAFKGDAKRGETLYLKGLDTNKSCAKCHGDTGLNVPKGSPPDYDDFVGTVANKNPWEFLHKIRFGQPGTKMPAAITAEVTMQDVIDLCAYGQTLPKSK